MNHAVRLLHASRVNPVPGTLTTDHPASSYGQPVLVIGGQAYGPGDDGPERELPPRPYANEVNPRTVQSLMVVNSISHPNPDLEAWNHKVTEHDEAVFWARVLD